MKCMYVYKPTFRIFSKGIELYVMTFSRVRTHIVHPYSFNDTTIERVFLYKYHGIILIPTIKCDYSLFTRKYYN